MGFATGMILGLNFHRENWLGGYGSHRRRLYRLGHISFFGLGVVNAMFYGTASVLRLASHFSQVAAWAFIVGAATMPVCCLIMAHWPKGRMLFAIPVSSLLTGGVLTLWEIIKL